MSAHMKKRPTKSKHLNMVHRGMVYKIPDHIAKQYLHGPIEDVASSVSDGSILADELFAELDKQYTKPGVLLQGIRHREGLSQVKFAKLIRVTQSDLSKMENGKRSIGKILAKRIADQFDVNYRSLLG